MNISIIGVEIDDLFDLMYDDKYKNAFFIYCDVEEFCYSCDDEGGFKRIRKFNNYWFRRCVGIPVCSRVEGCYIGINTFTRQMIDNAFRIAAESILKYGFDTIYYQIAEQQHEIKNEICVYDEHPFVNITVVQYIMKKLQDLSTQNIRLMIKRRRANTI